MSITKNTQPLVVLVDGRPIRFNNGIAYLFDHISHAGYIKIVSIGAENLFFTFKDDSGVEREGYCKCL